MLPLSRGGHGFRILDNQSGDTIPRNIILQMRGWDLGYSYARSGEAGCRLV